MEMTIVKITDTTADEAKYKHSVTMEEVREIEHPIVGTVTSKRNVILSTDNSKLKVGQKVDFPADQFEVVTYDTEINGEMKRVNRLRLKF